MPVPCPPDCENGVPYDEWQILPPVVRAYYTYCALVAAGNLPPEGPFQPIGVYTVTTDAPYDVPADASLIIWNVPGQAGPQTISFPSTPAGAEVEVFVENSNGQTVNEINGVFSLNDVAPRWVNVRSTDGFGTVILSDGSAAQYEVGTSGPAVPLLNTANTWGATQTLDAGVMLRLRPTGSYIGAQVDARVDLFNSAGALAILFNTSAYDMFFAGNGSVSAQGSLGFNVAGASISALTLSGTGAGRFPVSLAIGTTGTAKINETTNGVTMAGGTVVVADTLVTAFPNTTFQLTFGFAPTGTIWVAPNPGVGFTINSTNAADAGPVYYTRVVK